MDRGKNAKKKYLFNVDIMVEGYSNGIALETLLHSLNQEKFLDYEVKTGIDLGQLIRNAMTAESSKEPKGKGNTPPEVVIKESMESSNEPNAQKEAATLKINSLRADHHASKKRAESAMESSHIITHRAPEDRLNLSFLGVLDNYKNNNTLVRLTILKGKGIKISIPCRILNYEEATDSLTVYHVDEKIVYQFRLTEVDDLSVNV